MTRDIENAVQGESNSAQERGKTHARPGSGCERKTITNPKHEADQQKQSRESAHFHRAPEPVALRMDRFARGDEILPGRRKNGAEISETNSKEGRLLPQLKGIMMNGNPRILLRRQK